jgi:hypothetical protein
MPAEASFPFATCKIEHFLFISGLLPQRIYVIFIIPQLSGYDQLPTSMIVCNLEIFHKQFMFLLFCYVVADAFGFSRTFPNAGSMLLHMFVTVFTSA